MQRPKASTMSNWMRPWQGENHEHFWSRTKGFVHGTMVYGGSRKNKAKVKSSSAVSQKLPGLDQTVHMTLGVSVFSTHNIPERVWKTAYVLWGQEFLGKAVKNAKSRFGLIEGVGVWLVFTQLNAASKACTIEHPSKLGDLLVLPILTTSAKKTPHLKGPSHPLKISKNHWSNFNIIIMTSCTRTQWFWFYFILCTVLAFATYLNKKKCFSFRAPLSQQTTTPIHRAACAFRRLREEDAVRSGQLHEALPSGGLHLKGRLALVAAKRRDVC